MSYESTVSDHYQHGDLTEAIRASLAKLGKTIDNVTIEDLAPVDEFHIGGRLATERFLGQLDLSSVDHVLDVGCGLGGAARFVADRYGNQVTGIDLAPEYIDTGTTLCSWVNLDERITLEQGSALSMPFAEETFDGGYMLHVGMNIEDKAQLFAEIQRVLRPGASFGVYDVMRNEVGDLAYPVPWATDGSTCKLATADQYQQALGDAGFEVSKQTNRREFALEFFAGLRAKMEANGGPPPLGLHTLMKESTGVKLKNMIDNVTAGYVAPVEIIARKY